MKIVRCKLNQDQAEVTERARRIAIKTGQPVEVQYQRISGATHKPYWAFVEQIHPPKPDPALDPIVSIARSFSYKLNVGNYESRDFFCSQTAESKSSEAEATSERIYAFCKAQVLKAVNEYRQNGAN